jgi:pyruvate,orthophosphate dikinase
MALTETYVFPLNQVSPGFALGGSGVPGMIRLATLGLPVPDGFAIAPEVREEPIARQREQIGQALDRLERATGRRRLRVSADPGVRLSLSGVNELVEAVGATSGWVVVQAAVSGALDAQSGSGIVFTRDPANGSPGAFGRFFAGHDADSATERGGGEPLYTLRVRLPEAFEALDRAIPRVETTFRDMCQIRFVVESGKLWILDVSPGRRNAAAALRIAVDLVDEGLIEVAEAPGRVPLPAIARLQWPVLAANQRLDVIARGTPEVPGVAAGRIVFEAMLGKLNGSLPADSVLVCAGAGPANAETARRVSAILSAAPDGLRHLVAGPPAVWIKGLEVDSAGGRATLPGGRELIAGQHVTVDGGSGIVAAGRPAMVPAQPPWRIARLLAWCEQSSIDIVPEAAPGDVVIDLGPDLDERCEAAVAAGARALALRVPDGPFGTDPHPPAGPWRRVIARPGREWAGRLLAARLVDG